MTPDPKNFRALLDDVLPADAPYGPDRVALLQMVRRERTRRRSRRMILAAGCAAAVMALLLLWHAASVQQERAPLAAVPPLAPSIVIHEVDDQQLLSLLQGTPAALMEWPNGDRALLVMQP